jgi:hypothetical protein
VGWRGGGKVNSTCCRVHKNAELVPDIAGIRMYVRTTRQVWVDIEILVMYQSDRGFFGGVQGRCRCCLCEKRDLACFRAPSENAIQEQATTTLTTDSQQDGSRPT